MCRSAPRRFDCCQLHLSIDSSRWECCLNSSRTIREGSRVTSTQQPSEILIRLYGSGRTYDRSLFHTNEFIQDLIWPFPEKFLWTFQVGKSSPRKFFTKEWNRTVMVWRQSFANFMVRQPTTSLRWCELYRLQWGPTSLGCACHFRITPNITKNGLVRQVAERSSERCLVVYQSETLILSWKNPSGGLEFITQ